MKLRGILRQRSKGNCFASCIVNGLQLQKDQNLKNDILPEGKVYEPNILYDDYPEKELAAALTYIEKNGFEVKLIDADLMKDNNWGKNLDKIPKENIEERNYTLEDIQKLANDGYSVIFSTWSADDQGNPLSPHAVLAHKKKLYDPQNLTLWKHPQKLSTYLARKKIEDEKVFLIAFRKFQSKPKMRVEKQG